MILAGLMVYVLQELTNSKIEFKKKVIFIIGYGLVIGLCSYLNAVIRLVIICIVFIEVVHRYFKVGYYKTIISGFLGFLFVLIGDLTSVLILSNIVGFTLKELKAKLIPSLLVYLIIVVVVVGITNAIKKLNKVIGISDGQGLRNSIVSIVFLFFSIILLAVMAQIYTTIPGTVDKVYMPLFLTLAVVFIIINFVVIYINRRYIAQKIEYDQLKMYTGIVENLVSDIRRFRHDYVNVISSINGYVENEDVDGLKKYFNNEIIKESKILYNNNNMLQLQNILNPAVKGLISSKIVQAENLGINLTVEIASNIDEIPAKTMDVCRILGILIDNAIEAAVVSERNIMNIGLIEDEENIVFVVSNSFDTIPRIDDMFKEGFSTKGENRGIGLSTVRNLVDNLYKNMLLNTFIEDGIIKQELNIKRNRK